MKTKSAAKKGTLKFGSPEWRAKHMKVKGKGKSAAKVPAKKVIAKVDKQENTPPPVAKPKPLNKPAVKKMPQRKPNKVMTGDEMLAKGMAKLGNGHG